MIIFDYQEMFDFIADIAYDDDLDSSITERLQEEFSDFENGHYNFNDLETAITGNQKELFTGLFDIEDYDTDPEAEYKKHLKAFKKLKPEFIFEVVSRMCFLYGMAYTANLYERNRKK